MQKKVGENEDDGNKINHANCKCKNVEIDVKHHDFANDKPQKNH